MGKAKRIKQQRRGSARRTVIVDACEIGQRDGMLTFRVGDVDQPPVCLAIPAVTATGLVSHLRAASLDAEESYRQAVGVALQGVAPGDADAAAAAVRSFLLRQDWAGVLRRVPGGEMFLVSHAGHVGLAIAPPYVGQSSLVIFDPLQLRRLAPSFQSALAAAHASRPPFVTPETVAAVVGFLAAQPWPAGGHAEPSLEQAGAEMRERYRSFLTREPYLRPAKHDVPDA